MIGVMLVFLSAVVYELLPEKRSKINGDFTKQ